MASNLLNTHLEYEAICYFVENNSRVLDLGCGGGDLLKLLHQEKNIHGIGVEKSDEKILDCIKKSIAVHHGDIDEGLADFPDQSFDYVILSETLQEVHKPALVIEEMLRVGKKGLLTFPNFGNWRVRLQVLLYGSTPMTSTLPYYWYDTPNIQYMSVSDFEQFCRAKHYLVEDRLFFSFGRRFSLRPNLLAESALFIISKPQ